MKRLFVSINLPEEIKETLHKQQKEIHTLFPKRLREKIFKWSDKENLHITLAFLGKTKQERVEEVRKILEDTLKDFSSFKMDADKICYGPGDKIPPRLIWLKLKKNKDFIDIVKNTKRKLYEKNLSKKPRKNIIPHITLARIKKWAWKRIERDERPDFERKMNFSFKVNSVEIMESKLRKSGPKYLELESIKL